MHETTEAAKTYAEARAEWLHGQLSSDIWSLAQLLVSTVDIHTKQSPRTIRGLSLNAHERKLLASFISHMQNALG